MPLSHAKQANGSSAWSAVEPLLDPFLEFGRAIRAWAHPEELGSRIIEREIDLGSLCRFLLASAVLSALIGKLLPDEQGEAVFTLDVPFLDDVLGVLALTAGGVLNAMVFFKPLHWVGGTGSFGDTVIAGVYATGATYPVITLGSGLCWLLHAQLPGAWSFCLGIYLMRSLAVIHGVPVRRAFQVYGGIGLVLMVAGFVLAMLIGFSG
jgi:hypothetical protein